MQRVPNAESVAESSSNVASDEAAPMRWSRIPRVQLLRNKSDQRVPLYFDQTVPVWPRREPVRGGGGGSSSSQHSMNASPSSRSPLALHAAVTPLGRRAKAARKFEESSETVWFRGLGGVLKSSTAEAHACNVSEILRGCGCERAPVNSSSSPPGFPYALNSSRWSGIEQDLFTCTSVDPKVFVVPTAAEFISNKKSRNKSKSKD